MRGRIATHVFGERFMVQVNKDVWGLTHYEYDNNYDADSDNKAG